MVQYFVLYRACPTYVIRCASFKCAQTKMYLTRYLTTVHHLHHIVSRGILLH
jgi:hypothetical protein